MPSEQRSGHPPGKVLLFQPFHFDLLGGVDVVVENLWRGLERQQPGLASIGVQDWTKAGDFVDAEGRRFLHINLPQPPDKGLAAQFRYFITLLRRIPPVVRELRRRDITVVNFHFLTLNVFPLALIKRLGLWRGRLVLSFHGSDVLAVDPKRPAWKLIASQVDEVTACSNALAEQVKALNLFRRPPQVVYNGIDIPGFLKRADGVSLPVPEPYILNVGTFVSNKGQDVLLEAFALIARSRPLLNLVFVGGTDNGVWLATLRERVAALGLEERVFFFENQPQKHVAALMKNAVCLAHSSHREGLPIVLIEAGACSLPIVSTQVGGIPEIIESTEQGLLVEPANSGALASAIAAVLELPAEADRRAENLRSRINCSFSAESMVSGYRRAYLNV
ncbi:glycosyltransferase family 4 protein [Zoogloea sp.]|uniref:glycosyltransferase family 4 protein n=1 Tax=Zoogloea sp. TaxID=49181 RepID=UPI002632DC98|nr:glycosyltransferase family 4 protein [Zoogloea sp.]MDD3352551.1 glycosyltransferase family 4 protein [Zoogloea sp.]